MGEKVLNLTGFCVVFYVGRTIFLSLSLFLIVVDIKASQHRADNFVAMEVAENVGDRSGQ